MNLRVSRLSAAAKAALANIFDFADAVVRVVDMLSGSNVNKPLLGKTMI